MGCLCMMGALGFCLNQSLVSFLFLLFHLSLDTWVLVLPPPRLPRLGWNVWFSLLPRWFTFFWFSQSWRGVGLFALGATASKDFDLDQVVWHSMAWHFGTDYYTYEL